MKAQLISKKYSESSESIKESIKQVQKVLHDPDFHSINTELTDLLESFDKPFMFVVIGEVKSGKSSFVNSLTQEEICKVDADICTDKIHQILYSPNPYVKPVEKFIEEHGVPSSILQDVSIVDTPGTDSIISEHEEITRRFAPNSNIIFFVFPALNPHHSSSWEMLNIMKDKWSRDIIFIAAQSDRCTEKELDTGIQRIRTYARVRGIENPVIFTTSSKWEEEELYEKSGYREIRDYITDMTNGGKHMVLKLKDRIEIALIISDKIESKRNQREEILREDKVLRDKINMKFESGFDNSIKEISKILDRMNFVFEKTSGEYLRKLKQSLSTGNILRQALPLPRLNSSKHKVDRQYLESILTEMNKELEKNLTIEAADNASFFIDGIKYRFSEIIREVETARKLYSSHSGDDALQNFINKREEILKEILTGLTEMSTDLSIISTMERHNPDIGDTVLKGGVIAAAGALLSLIAQGAIFDATGGILSALGILGAGGIILFKRNKLIKEFKKNIEQSNEKFNNELHLRFKKKMNFIFDDIARQFEKMDKHIANESDLLTSISDELSNFRNQMLLIRKSIKI